MQMYYFLIDLRKEKTSRPFTGGDAKIEKFKKKIALLNYSLQMYYFFAVPVICLKSSM